MAFHLLGDATPGDFPAAGNVANFLLELAGKDICRAKNNILQIRHIVILIRA